MTSVSGGVTEKTVRLLTELGKPEKTWVIVGAERERQWNIIENVMAQKCEDPDSATSSM